VSTGVSGVTGLSPSLSVASDSDRMAYSVYRHGGYEINMKDLDPNALAQIAVDTTPHMPPPVLAPAPEGSFADRPYHGKLSLDRFVQPYLSAGGGGTGGFIRGGVGLSFADMLANQQADLLIQAGKGVDDFIVQAGYVNMRSRWNWGILGGQVPWLTGGLTTPIGTSASGLPIAQQTDVYR